MMVSFKVLKMPRKLTTIFNYFIVLYIVVPKYFAVSRSFLYRHDNNVSDWLTGFRWPWRTFVLELNRTFLNETFPILDRPSWYKISQFAVRYIQPINTYVIMDRMSKETSCSFAPVGRYHLIMQPEVNSKIFPKLFVIIMLREYFIFSTQMHFSGRTSSP